jgi:hypothetical protein
VPTDPVFKAICRLPEAPSMVPDPACEWLVALQLWRWPLEAPYAVPINALVIHLR